MKANKRKYIPVQCKICGHQSPSHPGLATHLRNCHHITPKEYFDTYIEPFEHKCDHCGSTDVNFINIRIGYAKSCGSHDCAIKEGKRTRFNKYGDENYSNREKFKKTLKYIKQSDPTWQDRINAKVKETLDKHIKEDPQFYNKRTLKSRSTKKDRYGDEFYNGKEKREKTLMENFGVINVFQLDSVKEKCRQSNIKNLGVDYPMKSQVCLNKRVETYRKNYGVDNPSKLKSNRDQAKQTTKDRYGDPNYRNIEQQRKTNAKKTKEEKEAIIKKREKYNLKHYGVKTPLALHTHRQSISKLSIHIKNILDIHNIKYEMEYKIQVNDIRRFYDFKIDNTILEINGDYYHANPIKYSADDVLIIHHIQYKVKDIWEYDKHKKILAENIGLTVKYLWEYDIKRMKDDEIWKWLVQNILN